MWACGRVTGDIFGTLLWSYTFVIAVATLFSGAVVILRLLVHSITRIIVIMIWIVLVFGDLQGIA